MFFLFGVRRKEKTIGQVERPCSKCARPTVHTALELKTKLSGLAMAAKA